MRQVAGLSCQQTRGRLVFTPACYTCCGNAKVCVLVLAMLPGTPTGLVWPGDGGESVVVLSCALRFVVECET